MDVNLGKRFNNSAKSLKSLSKFVFGDGGGSSDPVESTVNGRVSTELSPLEGSIFLAAAPFVAAYNFIRPLKTEDFEEEKSVQIIIKDIQKKYSDSMNPNAYDQDQETRHIAMYGETIRMREIKRIAEMFTELQKNEKSLTLTSLDASGKDSPNTIYKNLIGVIKQNNEVLLAGDCRVFSTPEKDFEFMFGKQNVPVSAPKPSAPNFNV